MGLIRLKLLFVLYYFNLNGIDEVSLNSLSVLLVPDPAHANEPSCVPAWETPLLLC